MTALAKFMSQPLGHNHRFSTKKKKNYKLELHFDQIELQLCLPALYFIFCKLENLWKHLTLFCKYPIIF